jgi:hypothetical protein
MLIVPEPVTEATPKPAFPLIVRVYPEAISRVPEPVKDKDVDILFSIVSVYPEAILIVPVPEIVGKDESNV